MKQYSDGIDDTPTHKRLTDSQLRQMELEGSCWIATNNTCDDGISGKSTFYAD